MLDPTAIPPVPAHVDRPVILSYGLGVDSTAILLRWLSEPASRDFPLSHLTVVVAHTGDEWANTGALVTEHILPRLRAAGVRLVQVARRGPSLARDGVVVLDDSRAPRTLYSQGTYKLSDEMFAAGTVPQTGGTRICSIHAKGEPNDLVIAHLVGSRPYRHVLGFESGECRRADKDRTYDTDQRHGEYPLITWKWDRADCLERIFAETGQWWPKSACSFCPFSLSNQEGRARTLERFTTEPEPACLALRMEHTATALNPRQGLLPTARLIDLARGFPSMGATLERFAAQVADAEHALYRVRRVWPPKREAPARAGRAARAVEIMATGSRGRMRAQLAATAFEHTVQVDMSDADHPRAWVQRRSSVAGPGAEEFYTTAPATARHKVGRTFPRAWADQAQQALF
ncbi:hypothetical protein [Nocardiopsis sp. NRRL B-16309]|uniref:hypothetical protein n=1 Tax=Nocardiopsis sp. NRRL B-16309 TaxID=1519494 RepID=UPI0006AF6312|nr:hypothetical protein [Nocardiopsis sp. NRRL B-16309]